MDDATPIWEWPTLKEDRASWTVVRVKDAKSWQFKERVGTTELNRERILCGVRARKICWRAGFQRQTDKEKLRKRKVYIW